MTYLNHYPGRPDDSSFVRVFTRKDLIGQPGNLQAGQFQEDVPIEVLTPEQKTFTRPGEDHEWELVRRIEMPGAVFTKHEHHQFIGQPVIETHWKCSMCELHGLGLGAMEEGPTPPGKRIYSGDPKTECQRNRLQAMTEVHGS